MKRKLDITMYDLYRIHCIVINKDVDDRGYFEFLLSPKLDTIIDFYNDIVQYKNYIIKED